MEGYFEIFMYGSAVGKACVSREGLYYRFVCRCQMSGQSVCRILANGISLGIPVPSGDGFELKTRLPIKYFPADTWDFTLMPNRPVLEGTFVPISPEEPFAYLERLKECYLVNRDNRLGILVK